MELGYALLLDDIDTSDIAAKENLIQKKAGFTDKLDDKDNVPHAMVVKGNMSLSAEEIKNIADAMAKVLRRHAGDIGCIMDNVLPVEYVNRELGNGTPGSDGKVRREYIITLKDKNKTFADLQSKVRKLCRAEDEDECSPGVFIGRAETKDPFESLMEAQYEFSSVQGKPAIFSSVAVYGYASGKEDWTTADRKLVYKAKI